MALSECTNEVLDSGREKFAHGTQTFPLACYADNFRLKDVPWHWHDELEAAVITEGSISLVIDKEKCVMKQGEGFFVNAGVLHAAKYYSGEHCGLHSIVFHPRLLSNGIDGIYWQKYLQPLITNTSMKSAILTPDVPWQSDALSCLECAWQSAVAEADGYEFEVRNQLSNFLFSIIKYNTPAASKPTAKSVRDNERIKIMLQFIADHFSEPLTMASIADSALISESECLRCFRSTLGTSPIKYVKTVRLQKAAELLSQSDMNITAIGDACGFQDMSYFAKSFLAYKGCSPSGYRNMEQNA